MSKKSEYWERKAEMLDKKYEEKFGEPAMHLVMQSLVGHVEMVEKALKTGKPIDYDEERPQSDGIIY